KGIRLSNPPGPTTPSDFKSVSVMVSAAFTAGFPAMVTRPLIEAVRGRLSRCGVCAFDWLTAIRSDIDRVERRSSRLGFIGRLLPIVAQKKIQASALHRLRRSLSELCASQYWAAWLRLFLKDHQSTGREAKAVSSSSQRRLNSMTDSLRYGCQRKT